MFTVIEDDLLQILQHSLGVDRYGQGKQYRNHYVAGPDDAEKCRRLVSLGYMKRMPATQLSGGDPVFIVTPRGIDYVAMKSPTPPKMKRSKKRYRDWLQSDCGLTFGEYIGAKK